MFSTSRSWLSHVLVVALVGLVFPMTQVGVIYADQLDTWSTKPSGTTHSLRGVTYGNGTFVAVGDGGTILQSVSSDCAATLSSDFKAHVPIGIYNGQSYSADFQWDGGDGVILTNLSLLNDTSAFSNCIPSTVSSALILHIPEIIYEGVSYWADVQCNTERSPFKIIGVGQNVTYKVYGLDFSPYIDGQDPNLGSQISEDQLKSRMSIIAPYTQWIRSFGSTGGLEQAGSVAHGLNLKAAVGAWLSNNLSANEQEISNLISAAKAGYVDLAIVGSEVLLRNDLTETQLIAYINRVKQEAPGIQVTTADVYSELLAHPSVISACDIILVNYYPYWEGIKVDQAIASLHGWHQQMIAAAGGKSVIVSETGWPSDGDQVGNAVPSVQNASFYFLNFVSWARANNVSYFYFEAFDESWKAAYEGSQGAHWGVWDKNGTLKPGMQDIFDGKTMPDNWSNALIPGGPGTPSIEFTYVPQYGSYDNVKGQVWHVKPADYKVAIYIYVSGWWTKPYFSSPLTTIQSDGSWECDITTGGVDQNATIIAAYLLPNSYNPPLASGSSTLPSELDSNAVAKVEKTRSP